MSELAQIKLIPTQLIPLGLTPDMPRAPPTPSHEGKLGHEGSWSEKKQHVVKDLTFASLPGT